MNTQTDVMSHYLSSMLGVATTVQPDIKIDSSIADNQRIVPVYKHPEKSSAIAASLFLLQLCSSLPHSRVKSAMLFKIGRLWPRLVG